MLKNEFEFVKHSRLADVRLFLVDLAYRNLHMHNEFELCLVLSEQIEVYAQRRTFLFSQGDLLLLNPKQPHEIHAAERGRAMLLSLQVSPKFCSRYFPLIRNVEFDRIDIGSHLDPDQVRSITGKLSQLSGLYFKGGEHYELAAYALLNALFFELLQQIPWRFLSEDEKAAKTTLSERLSRIMEYIESHYTEKILLSDIARQENLSLAYLSHYFKDHLNMNFQDYVALLRFEDARALVEHTSLTLTDISVAAGFSDKRYLDKVFAKQLGCSPADYRERLIQRPPEQTGSVGGAIQRILSDAESIDYLRTWKPSI
jgi:AraC-like DNA-binding protein